ncbi:polyhydroxyalkanoate synthase [Pseudomonas duriflava]|uniref:Polyhydroxyalkanoate synthase n=1 Tax=Pseudomonas duriflava TaxID=459528 RepID=A0A562PUB7_9PSED|nr:class I poly(R)-hydroxyalkanoic acid synthase [Pseudomonas duriflava]TWI48014.1 polyhydroxyalkanoate synthase [Pseudomonas duriflava]
MDQAQSFTRYWSAQSPFVATFAVHQLRLWMNTIPWFAGKAKEEWFEVPTERLEEIQAAYQQEWNQLGLQLLMQKPFSFTDKRFASDYWSLPSFGSLAAFYLLNSRYMLALIDSLPVDEKKPRQRLRYLIEQAIAAAAPSNFLAYNPDALDTLVKSSGASLALGMLNLANDLQEGKLRQCDKSDFVIGRDLATTPGHVVFENDLFQLIHYSPRSQEQYRHPLFITPPAINKYYIMDLRPENSLVRYALEQGHAVFIMSWRNFDHSGADLTWDNFVEDAVIKGMRVAQTISGSRQLNCVGFCIGGTLLTCALAVLAARGEPDIASSLTLLATFLDYDDPGVIDIFIDEATVAYHESAIGGKNGTTGLFRGQDMANMFSLLRPNDLWWNYTVDKYLKGNKPRALDLLFWNNDSTNLPGPMFCWYLRHTYLQNDLKSGELECCGVRLDLQRIATSTYLLATQDDHIVPWGSVYRGSALFSGESRFVLGASGHIAGVINHPAQNKRHYWVNDETPDDSNAWLAGTEQKPGSWWQDWFAWLAPRSGEQRTALEVGKSSEYPVLEPAPGRYVLG